MAILSRLALPSFRKKSLISRIRYFSSIATKSESTASDEWEPVIGLEIHAQISAESKLFSGAATAFSAPTNTQVSFLDASLPGTLPVLNRRCVEAGVLTALALNCEINMVSKFDRKHYFYADLPAGYQITQQRQPLAVKGEVAYVVYNRNLGIKEPLPRTARLIQLQLEQDSGKSLHDADDSISLIDLNRAGVGLMEIVTEPDFRTSEEACSFVKELQLILMRTGVCDGKMQEGSLRVDASVSLRRPGDPLGTRSEVKNLNSIRSVRRAIDHEISRQKDILNGGGEVDNDTRTFNTITGETIAMRDKEKVHDYRFMPEPNLPPLYIYNNHTAPRNLPKDQIINVDALRRKLPSSLEEIRQMLAGHGIKYYNVITLLENEGLVDTAEKLLKLERYSATAIVDALTISVLGYLNASKITLSESDLTFPQIEEIVQMLDNRMLRAGSVIDALNEISDKKIEGASVLEVVTSMNLLYMKDRAIIEEACRELMADNPQVVEKYRKGKKRIINFFINRIKEKFDNRVIEHDVTKIVEEVLPPKYKK